MLAEEEDWLHQLDFTLEETDELVQEVQVHSDRLYGKSATIERYTYEDFLQSGSQESCIVTSHELQMSENEHVTFSK